MKILVRLVSIIILSMTMELVFAATTIKPGSEYHIGDVITSSDGGSSLYIDTSGELVFTSKFTNPIAVFIASGGNRLVMEADGRLAFYKDQSLIWSSSRWRHLTSESPGTSGAYAVIEDFGNISLYSSQGRILLSWPNEAAIPGQTFTSLANNAVLSRISLGGGQVGRPDVIQLYRQHDKVLPGFIDDNGLQDNSYFVSYGFGPDANHFTMGIDGNLVLFDQFNKIIWQTNTSGHPNAFAIFTPGSGTDYSFTIVQPGGGVISKVTLPPPVTSGSWKTQQVDPAGPPPVNDHGLNALLHSLQNCQPIEFSGYSCTL